MKKDCWKGERVRRGRQGRERENEKWVKEEEDEEGCYIIVCLKHGEREREREREIFLTRL